MKVKIRQEQGRHLAYFIDSRRMVGVNETGARILDMLFNHEEKVGAIAAALSADYALPLGEARRDVLAFLRQIKDEIMPNGFNILEQKQLSSPLGIELEITTACNLRCRHCFQGEHAEVFMPIAQAVAIINLMADNGVCEVSLIGGEPFRHPEIMGILECCDRRDLATNLVTNGTLVTPEIMDRLAQLKRLVLILSLDGVGQVHDHIRGQGVFGRVDPVLRELRRRAIPLEVICTLNSVNLPDYRAVVEHCRTLDVPCNFNIFKPFREDHRILTPDPGQFFDSIVDLLALRRDEGFKIGLSNAAIIAELRGLPPRNECRATQSGLVVNVSGQMVTCPSLLAAGYYRGTEMPMFDGNFLETWREHPIFQDFRQHSLRQCQARSFIFSGDVDGADPYGIDAFRKFRQART